MVKNNKMIKTSYWHNLQKKFINLAELGISLDTTMMRNSDDLPNFLEKLFAQAFKEMDKLEKGNIANPDENRMVGHYWLRNPELAPTLEIQSKIKDTIKKIEKFTSEIHQGEIRPQNSDAFKNLLLIGIGGSVLGAQFLHKALFSKKNRMQVHFLDNTDPDGIDQVMSEIGLKIKNTLTLVISKSGETKEIRNTMLEVRNFYKDSGLDFSKHAVAVTIENSKLSLLAKNESWLDCFPMWEWVGGRTSLLSSVGLLPAALNGIDIKKLILGAKKMDELTRCTEVRKNPAAILAWMWYQSGDGMGKKDMVILPYKDRLIFLSRYLQQLVMESLGKEKNFDGYKIHHGLTVYGNKGSTDQHALVQQLIEGPSNFFVTFIEVLKDRDNLGFEIEPGITSGDFLQGFLLGTRDALFQKGHESICITIEEVSDKTLAALIALFERAVGIYAFIIGVNAYNQPGVESGKKLARDVIELLLNIQQHLKSYPEQQFTASELSAALGVKEKTATVFRLLLRLAINGRIKKIPHSNPFLSTFKQIDN